MELPETKSRNHWLHLYPRRAGLPGNWCNCGREITPSTDTLKQKERGILVSTSKTLISCQNLSWDKTISNSDCKENIICIDSVKNKLWTTSPMKYINKTVWYLYKNSSLEKEQLIKTRDLDLEASSKSWNFKNESSY